MSINCFVTDSSNPIFVRGSKQQDQDTISSSDGINRIKLRIAKFLLSHKRAFRIAWKVNIAYGKIFGRAHVLPNAYVIGFGKCGTTALYTYLGEHPQINPPFIKEVKYFNRNERYKLGLNWYKTNFPLIIQKMIYERLKKKKFVSIDAGGVYITYPHTINRIKKITPEAKFIVLIRNPIDRAYSHYNMNVNDSNTAIEDLPFAEAIRQEESRIDGEYERMEHDEFYRGIEYFTYGYAHIGRYAKWLKNWLAEFPNQVLVLESESLTNDVQTTFDRVTDFLEVDRYKLRDTAARNVGNYAQGKIDESTRKYLAEYYRKPNAELYSLLGRNLGWD